MTINMTFSSFDEIVEFARRIAAGQTAPEGEKEITTIPVAKKEAPVKKAAVVKEEKQPVVAEEKKVSLEDVRAALGALLKAGKKEQVGTLLKEFGASKLPDIDPADYPALLKKVGELNA